MSKDRTRTASSTVTLSEPDEFLRRSMAADIGPTPSTAFLAAAVVVGTAVVLAPIDPQPLRDLNTPPAPPASPATPVPEPEPKVVINYDSYGTRWGTDTLTATKALIDQERAAGTPIDEWTTVDRAGQPLRIVRLADPSFLDTICVIPAADQAVNL